MKRNFYIILIGVALLTSTIPAYAQLTPKVPTTKAALKALENNAKNGDLQAQYELGYCYLNGIKNLQSQKVGAGKKLIKAAADAGHADACRLMYKIDPMHYEEYRQAATQKYRALANDKKAGTVQRAEALYCLADLYSNEPHTCLRYLRTAQQFGNSAANADLEAMYQNHYSREVGDYNNWIASLRPFEEFINVNPVREDTVHLVFNSDVDYNIPVTKGGKNDNTVAIVIGNQLYQHMPTVEYAMQDAKKVAEYCEKTLGIPHRQILYLPNATYGAIRNLMKNNLPNIASAFDGEIKLIFYYAGHGTPGEDKDKRDDAFIIPTDAENAQSTSLYSTSELFADLQQTGANQITVFMDACFTGTDRSGQSIYSGSRIVVKKPKIGPKGNMVVFSSTDVNQSAWPLRAQNHGLFTYYLLKQLQETQGDVSLEQLWQAVQRNVKREAALEMHKQTPTYESSPIVGDAWKTWKLNN